MVATLELERLEKNLDGDYTRILCVVLKDYNETTVVGPFTPISQTIQGE